MPFVYSARREKIELTPVPGLVAVRFSDAKAAVAASGIVNAATDGARGGGYGNVAIVPGPDAQDQPVAALHAILPPKLAGGAQRTFPVLKEERSGLRLVATEQITVRFTPRASAKQRNRVLADCELAILAPSPFLARQYLVVPVSLKSGYRTLDLANQLSGFEDLVEFATPNFLTEFRKRSAPNDPLFPKQWHLDNPGKDGATSGEDVRALGAWAITPGGDPSIVIAIIDDGVDLAHPDLQPNLWNNPDPTAPDRHGRDFQDPSSPNDPAARVFQPPYDDFTVNDIHGTCCAGVAAAAGDNRIGGAGIAHRCKILPVKIFGGSSLAPASSIADAIRYAGLHADVISCSWEIAQQADVESAIDDVTATGRKGKGCCVFAATGNEAKTDIGFPASHPNVVAVGASNDQGKRSSYSNYGKGISVVAPSGDTGRPGIVTTDVSVPNRGFNLKGGYFEDFSGTSSATPLAAGVGALVLSVNPKLKWSEVRDILQNTADPIDKANGGYSKGYSLKYGHGRVNAEAAVRKAQTFSKSAPKMTGTAKRSSGIHKK